jgi:2-oxoglutarate dehydrogenase E2 component (dihydrolipoamide succinyltransferase)
MPVNVVMPQMGESVTEGTVVRWIRKIGDQVDRDEPLFEISTDKVDAEIPSPAAGTLAALHVHEGETVPVDALVAVALAGEDVEAVRRPTVARDDRAFARGAACAGRPALAAPAGTRQPRRSGREQAGAGGCARHRWSPHRQRAPGRHRLDSRLRHRRPCDERRHPRIHREKPAVER